MPLSLGVSCPFSRALPARAAQVARSAPARRWSPSPLIAGHRGALVLTRAGSAQNPAETAEAARVETTAQPATVEGAAPPQGYPQYYQYPPQQYGKQPEYSYNYMPQYPAPPPVYQRAPESSGGMPAYVWVLVGVVIAFVGAKIMEIVKGGPQAMQQKAAEMMMKQMMSQMGSGAAPGGFPGAAGMPAPPFGAGFPPSPPASTPSWATPSAATVDVKPVEPTAASTPKTAGASFQAIKAEEAKSKPTTSSSSSSFFADVSDEGSSSKPASSTATAAASSAGFGAAGGFGGGFPGGAAAGATNGSAAQTPAGNTTIDMLEQMMKDPEMQKTLYPYLPEPMRNPQTMEWMLSQPEYRAQMEKMLNEQMPAGMPMGGMGAMPDLNSPEVKAQFDQLGMSPQEVVSKILADPELAQAFQNPKIQQAVMELSTNPMAMMKYQNDPEVMNLLTKIMTVFPQAGGMRPPGMP